MKDVIVLAGGDSERGLLFRDKLASSKYIVRHCESLRDLCTAINEGKIAVILLLYPDGFGIIEELFANHITSGLDDQILVVFISTSSAENNRARSLHYKADEFLIEPISTDEIVKIIDEAIGSRPQSDDGHVLSIGELTLNRETLIVTWRNKKIPLYPLQVRILEFLMLNRGRTIGRDDLLKNVWSTGITIEYTTIDRNIKRIRDAFMREARVDPIRTVRRAGYAFSDRFEQLASLPRKGRFVK
jgi:two-component system, OmpR family, phosphate regulon response regulator PhoB